MIPGTGKCGSSTTTRFRFRVTRNASGMKPRMRENEINFAALQLITFMQIEIKKQRFVFVFPSKYCFH